MDWLSGIIGAVRRTFTRTPRAAVPPGQPASVAAVIAEMERIEDTTADDDGLAAFNSMYLQVTRRVEAGLASGEFRDRAYMERLTALFGGLYLEAVAGAEAGRNKAWAPLLQGRTRPGILPIQFALAGMNAHINYDLPVAVVRTSRQLGTDLGPVVAADYRAITALLAAEQEAVRQSFLGGLTLEVDRRVTGPVADLVSMWSISRARDAAWANARVLWELGGVEPLSQEFLATLARTVGMAGRMLLTPVLEPA